MGKNNDNAEPIHDNPPNGKIQQKSPTLTDSKVREIVKEELDGFSQRMKQAIRDEMVAALKNAGLPKAEKPIDESIRGKLTSTEGKVTNLKRELLSRFDAVDQAIKSGGSQLNNNNNELLARIDDATSKLLKIQIAESSNEESSNEDETETILSAAENLSNLNTNLEQLGKSILAFCDKSSWLGKQLSQAPTELSNAVAAWEKIESSMTGFLADLEGKSGNLGKFNESVRKLSDSIATSVDSVQNTIRGAEARLAEKQREVEAFAKDFATALDSQRLIRDEVVPTLGKFFDSINQSIAALSARIDQFREQLQLVDIVQNQQEKALLAMKFAETIKRAEKAFDAALTEVASSHSEVDSQKT